MLNSILGYVFIFVGLLILALPLILVELSRSRDWLKGGLFLFLGLFLIVEDDLLIGPLGRGPPGRGPPGRAPWGFAPQKK